MLLATPEGAEFLRREQSRDDSYEKAAMNLLVNNVVINKKEE